MSNEATAAQQHLQNALVELQTHCEPLAGLRLKNWYVITTHTDDDGEEILSRFTRPAQMPWTDVGLLTFALNEDRREWQEDDAPTGDDTYP